MTTILDDVKYGIGVLPGNDGFDSELLIHINSVAAILVQFGVDDYDIVIDDETEWPVLSNFQIEALVKQYFVVKTRMMFDTPANTAIANALEASLPSLEGRIRLIVEEVEAQV